MGILTPAPESPDNKAIRELCDELKDLNTTFKAAIKSNEKISEAVIIFALIQIIIAFLQLIFPLFQEGKPWWGLAAELTALALILFVLREFKWIGKKKNSREETSKLV